MAQQLINQVMKDPSNAKNAIENFINTITQNPS